MKNQQASLGEYMSASDWLAAQPHNPFFPVKSSFDWWVKRNRDELVERGALIPGRGRAGSIVHVEKMASAVVEIFKRRSAAPENLPR